MKPENTPIPALLLVVCVLLIGGCDLFNAAVQPDFLEKIDAEIAWANAEKLTVAIAFPSVWGASNPQQGTITPARDIRKDYEFRVEFSPSPDVGFLRWIALEGIVDIQNMSKDEIEQKALSQSEVSIIEEMGSTGMNLAKVTINVSMQITLVEAVGNMLIAHNK